MTQRTIRRDLEVIERAGFMLDQITVNDERRWILKRDFFSGVAARGFTLSEMCALYFSRSLLECFGGAPFHEDLTRAFDKDRERAPAWPLALHRAVAGGARQQGRRPEEARNRTCPPTSHV